MTAKETAIQDIMDDLKQESKCFLSFRKTLNPIMDRIVKSYCKKQEKKESGTK